MLHDNDAHEDAPRVPELSTRSCVSTVDANELDPLHATAIQVEDPAVVVKKPVIETTSTSKIQFLDGIRGLAVVVVVSHHLDYFAGRNLGAFGVDMFFVLSAFLLTMILDKKFRALQAVKAAPRRWGLTLIDYGVKRLLRVYPLFAVVAIMINFSSDEHKDHWYFVRQSTLGDNWSLFKVLTFEPEFQFFILWTLPLELTYYLIIPVFVVGMMMFKRWWWVPALPLLGWIVYSGLHVVRHSFTGLDVHLPTFVCGSLAAIVYNRFADLIKTTGFQFKTWQRIVLRTFEALVLLLLVSESFEALVFDWFGPSPFRLSGGDHFVSLHVAIIIVCEILQPGIVSMVFEWNLLRHAGKISFSVYLLHPRIIHSDFIKAQTNYYTHFFCVWILVFFWATVSYHVVELPCLRLAAWIGRKLKTLESEASEKQPQALFA